MTMSTSPPPSRPPRSVKEFLHQATHQARSQQCFRKPHSKKHTTTITANGEPTNLPSNHIHLIFQAFFRSEQQQRQLVFLERTIQRQQQKKDYLLRSWVNKKYNNYCGSHLLVLTIPYIRLSFCFRNTKKHYFLVPRQKTTRAHNKKITTTTSRSNNNNPTVCSYYYSSYCMSLLYINTWNAPGIFFCIPGKGVSNNAGGSPRYTYAPV